MLQVIPLHRTCVVRWCANSHVSMDVSDGVLSTSVECVADGAADSGPLHCRLVSARCSSLVHC